MEQYLFFIHNSFVEKEIPYSEYVESILRIRCNHKYSAIDLFAGCGGLSLGFEAAGIKTSGYEKDPDCCRTYRQNLKSECHQLFITHEMKFPDVDIVIGGPPCQPFSRFGSRKGQEDKRNGFPAFIQAVRFVRPKIFICENVKGLPELSHDYYEEVLSSFRSLGYIVDSKVIRMARYDVPQRRERLVIVGHHGGFEFPKENSYQITSGEALGEMACQIPEDAMFLTPSMDKYIAKYEAASKCAVPRDLHLDRPARTLTCRNLAGATSDMHRIRLPDGRRRRITVREAARLQSFPDWFDFSGSMESQFCQIGNAVPPMFAYRLAQSVIKYMEKTKNV